VPAWLASALSLRRHEAVPGWGSLLKASHEFPNRMAAQVFFPGSSSTFKAFNLLEASKLLFCCLSKKIASATLAR